MEKCEVQHWTYQDGKYFVEPRLLLSRNPFVVRLVARLLKVAVAVRVHVVRLKKVQ